jgi:16S rRNA (guanine966-N2)-methyltransferase
VRKRVKSPLRTRQRVRIIGGQWRGRRIEFPDTPELRPTPDRVRETLFNWLQGVIEGSRCLDLFAGSGALGFEAASRGATSVVMVDVNPQVVNHLRRQDVTLGASQVEVLLADALGFLRSEPMPFDIIFLDPPFHKTLLANVTQALEDYRALKAGARIYLEMHALPDHLVLPASWDALKNQRAGQVNYQLAIKGR